MREMRIVSDSGDRIAGVGTRVFVELAGGRFVTLRQTDLSRLLSRRLDTLQRDRLRAEIISLQ